MEQRKRPGQDGGVGYYTSWEKEENNGCIYCGKPAKTREHTPSKTLLIEPYPENLPTIPACFDCNNGFSADEMYVSCFLNFLKSKIFTDYALSPGTIARLEKNPKLFHKLKDEIRIVDKNVDFSFDNDKLVRILTKLARGHAGFELDHLSFNCDSIEIWYDFVFNLSENDMLTFNQIPKIDIAPEVGSRGVITPFVLQNIETGEFSTFTFWQDVQEGQYRYQTYYNEDGVIEVKIVILEMLYCRVILG